MSLNSYGMKRAQRVFGDVWSSDITGAEVFPGIFDSADETVEYDGRLQLERITTLLVSSLYARYLTGPTTTLDKGSAIVSPSGVTWYVRQVLRIDDGIFARLHIVTDDTTEFCP